jgi:hypothetical protein
MSRYYSLSTSIVWFYYTLQAMPASYYLLMEANGVSSWYSICIYIMLFVNVHVISQIFEILSNLTQETLIYLPLNANVIGKKKTIIMRKCTL